MRHRRVILILSVAIAVACGYYLFSASRVNAEHSNRCRDNLRELAHLARRFEAEHAGKAPVALSDLIDMPDGDRASLYRCPCRRESAANLETADEWSDYILVALPSNAPWSRVRGVCLQAHVEGPGANLAFVDGSSAWVSPHVATKVLRDILSNMRQ